jgi:hypothetical protein
VVVAVGGVAVFGFGFVFVFGFVCSGGVGSRVVVVVVVVVVVWVGGGGAMIVVPPLPPLPLRTIAPAAPAMATARPSNDIHTQSPGYQPKRRIQRRRSPASVPFVCGSRRPHSMQYS